MEKTEMMKRFEKETGIVAIYSQYDEWLQKDVFYPKDEYVDWLEAKAAAHDRLSTWHDDLPKNDGRYICVIGDGEYPVICAKKFENGRWLLGEREKIKWAYLPDGWEEKQ